VTARRIVYALSGDEIVLTKRGALWMSQDGAITAAWESPRWSVSANGGTGTATSLQRAVELACGEVGRVNRDVAIRLERMDKAATPERCSSPLKLNHKQTISKRAKRASREWREGSGYWKSSDRSQKPRQKLRRVPRAVDESDCVSVIWTSTPNFVTGSIPHMGLQETAPTRKTVRKRLAAQIRKLGGGSPSFTDVTKPMGERAPVVVRNENLPPAPGHVVRRRRTGAGGTK